MIHFIYQPSVVVISRPLFIRPSEESITGWICDSGATDSESLVEFAGRGCYRSWSNAARRTNAEYLANILAHEHYSVLEHANFTLWMTGISRSLSHELVRHRHLSLSQESQRFVPATDINFVVPPAYIGDEELEWNFKYECEWIEARYRLRLADMEQKFTDHSNATLAKKRAREAARSILPNACETRMTLTGNLRAWREMIDKRATIHSDAEICRLSVVIFRTLKPYAPAVWDDLEIVTDCGREMVRKGNVQ